jgi:hypothetical protein
MIRHDETHRQWDQERKDAEFVARQKEPRILVKREAPDARYDPERAMKEGLEQQRRSDYVKYVVERDQGTSSDRWRDFEESWRNRRTQEVSRSYRAGLKDQE